MWCRPTCRGCGVDAERSRGVVELLGPVLADALHLAAAGAGGVLGLVPDLGSRQVRRQRGALRDVLRRQAILCALEGQQFQTDGFEIGLDGLVEQMALLAVQLFAAGGELPALEDRHLVGELVELALLEGVVPSSVGELAAGIGDLADQLSGELAQFICVHPGQLIGRVHGPDAARSPRILAEALCRPDHRRLPDPMPGQADHESLQPLGRERPMRLRSARSGEPALMQ